MSAFDQERKDKAASVEDQCQSILSGFFDVPPARVVSAESELTERYDTREMHPVQLLDFAGVDWLIDGRPGLYPVAQRITKASGSGRMSIRTANGSNLPCEADVFAGDGISPTHYLFGWREDSNLTHAWILDAQRTFETMRDSPHTQELHNDDGTAAMFLDIGDLATAGCVLTGWSKQ